MRAALLVALSLCAASCESTVVTTAPDACRPVIDGLEPMSGPASGGTTVRVTGLHVGSNLGARDVVVHLGGERADVTDAVRGEGCGPCDACTAELFSCAQCERVCRGITSYTDRADATWGPGACEEWVEFTTPAHEPGEAELVLQNGSGGANGSMFLYEGDDDDSAGG